MKKIVSTIFLLASLLVGAILPAASITAQEDELIEINIAYMPNFGSSYDIITGINGGFFEEEGLKVNLVEFADGPTIIAAMESGSIDIGNIGPGAHVLPIQDRAEIIGFAHLGNADEVLGRTDKGVAALEDLAGKKIASASGTSAEQILVLTLEEAGLTVDDVEIIDMDASAIVTAMISGSIDAAATWSPNTTAIKNELGDDVVMLANNARYAEHFPSISSYAVTPGYVDENQETVERFLRGLYKAADYRSENMDQVVEWVAAQLAVDPASIEAQINDGDWKSAAEHLELVESGSLETYYTSQQENFITGGRLTEEERRDASEYVHFDLMLEALKAVTEE